MHRLAPLSATSWLAPTGDADSDKKGDDYATLSDDAAFSASFVLSSAVLNEEQRRLELLRDESCHSPEIVSDQTDFFGEAGIIATPQRKSDFLIAIQNPATISEAAADSPHERFLKCQVCKLFIFLYNYASFISLISRRNCILQYLSELKKPRRRQMPFTSYRYWSPC